MATPEVTQTAETASADGVAAIVDATELVELRVDEIHAGPLAHEGEDLSFRLGRGVPQFAFSADRTQLMVRLEHLLECGGSGQDRSQEGGQDGPVTKFEVAHVLSFAIADDFTAEAADVSAWIQSNVYFIVYPYVRQIFTTLTSAMGLPPVVLGYMKRDDWPEFDEVLDAGEGGEAQ